MLPLWTLQEGCSLDCKKDFLPEGGLRVFQGSLSVQERQPLSLGVSGGKEPLWDSQPIGGEDRLGEERVGGDGDLISGPSLSVTSHAPSLPSLELEC